MSKKYEIIDKYEIIWLTLVLATVFYFPCDDMYNLNLHHSSLTLGPS